MRCIRHDPPHYRSPCTAHTYLNASQSGPGVTAAAHIIHRTQTHKSRAQNDRGSRAPILNPSGPDLCLPISSLMQPESTSTSTRPLCSHLARSPLHAVEPNAKPTVIPPSTHNRSPINRGHGTMQPSVFSSLYHGEAVPVFFSCGGFIG